VAASQSTSGKDKKHETLHCNKHEVMQDNDHFVVTTAISQSYHRLPPQTAITDRHLTQLSPTAISHSYHRPQSLTGITDHHLTQLSPTAISHSYHRPPSHTTITDRHLPQLSSCDNTQNTEPNRQLQPAVTDVLLFTPYISVYQLTASYSNCNLAQLLPTGATFTNQLHYISL
jgi:hypothetical protein